MDDYIQDCYLYGIEKLGLTLLFFQTNHITLTCTQKRVNGNFLKNQQRWARGHNRLSAAIFWLNIRNRVAQVLGGKKRLHGVKKMHTAF
jgi:hypothetical protein